MIKTINDKNMSPAISWATKNQKELQKLKSNLLF